MGETPSIKGATPSFQFKVPSDFNYFTVMIGNTWTLELLFAPPLSVSKFT
jgi:hypothetical protein